MKGHGFSADQANPCLQAELFGQYRERYKTNLGVKMCFRPGTLSIDKTCPQCGAKVELLDTECPDCGEKLPVGMGDGPGAPAAPGAPLAPGAPVAPDAPVAPAAPAAPKA